MPLDRERILPRLPPRTLYFDGVDDYASVPDDPSLRGFTEATWEWLYYAKSLSNSKFLRTDVWTYIFGIYDESYALELWNYAGTKILAWITTTSATLEAWTHVAVTYSDYTDTAKLYINGALKETTTTSDDGPIRDDPFTQLRIGQYTEESQAFNGYIALVRIYNRALSDSEITYNYYHPSDPVRDGLVLWLHWDSIDTGAGKWYDKTYLDNDATIYGATEQVFTQDVVRKRTPVRLQSIVR